MPRKLFGTDGVRGVAGEFVTAELALALGRAASEQTGVERPRVLIVRDTRESGEMLQAAVAAGVSAAGGDALLGGVLPTPAAPLLLGRYGFDLAVVLSASHNPFQDNGIKFFAGDGYKLTDDAERAIERLLETRVARRRTRPHRSRARAARGPRGLSARAARALRGSSTSIGRRRAARLRQRRDLPRRARDLPAPRRDGQRDRGRAGRAQHQRWRAARRTSRSWPSDRGGRTRRSASPSTATATACLRSTARARWSTATSCSRWPRCTCARAGGCSGDGVAVTVMTNYGFHSAMERGGHERGDTSVGDRYVLEALRARGWALGGEQSGHIIEMGFNRTGDGIAARC